MYVRRFGLLESNILTKATESLWDVNGKTMQI